MFFIKCLLQSKVSTLQNCSGVFENCSHFRNLFVKKMFRTPEFVQNDQNYKVYSHFKKTFQNFKIVCVFKNIRYFKTKLQFAKNKSKISRMSSNVVLYYVAIKVSRVLIINSSQWLYWQEVDLFQARQELVFPTVWS